MPDNVSRRELIWGAGGLLAIIIEIVRIILNEYKEDSHSKEDAELLNAWQTLANHMAKERLELIEKCRD